MSRKPKESDFRRIKEINANLLDLMNENVKLLELVLEDRFLKRSTRNLLTSEVKRLKSKL